MAFHNVLFPVGLARGAVGGPKVKVEIVTVGTGAEKRNSPWANGRREYRVPVPPNDLAARETLNEFFLARHGQLYSFSFRDLADYSSAAANGTPTMLDQTLVHDGVSGSPSTGEFQLIKTYEPSGPLPRVRNITKPRSGTVLVAVNGALQTDPGDYTIDLLTGILTFVTMPGPSDAVTAGYLFDVPLRFNEDILEVTMVEADIVEYTSVSLIEVDE